MTNEEDKSTLNQASAQDTPDSPTTDEPINDEKPQATEQKSHASSLLFYYNILMFTLPFVAFFIVRQCLLEFTYWPEIGVNALSVFSSVIAIYSVMAVYYWHASQVVARSNVESENTADKEKKDK